MNDNFSRAVLLLKVLQQDKLITVHELDKAAIKVSNAFQAMRQDGASCALTVLRNDLFQIALNQAMDAVLE